VYPAKDYLAPLERKVPKGNCFYKHFVPSGRRCYRRTSLTDL